MDAKLTLKLDKEVIELAKEYVKKRGTSLSKFIEEMLRHKISPKPYELNPDELHPLVREMAEKFKGGKKVPDDFDYKKAKADYLIKKYGE